MADKYYTDDQVSRLKAPQVNLLINGQMDIWQRGTGPETISSVPNIETADRWAAERTGTGSANFQSVSTVPNSNYRNSLKFNSLDTGGKNLIVWQRVEGDTMVPFIGKTMHVGAWVKSNAGSIVTGIYVVSNPSGTRDSWADAENLTKTIVESKTDFSTVNDVWQYNGLNFTVTAECEDGLAVGFRFGTIDEVGIYNLTGCRLHQGDSKLPWSDLKRTYAEEERLCQRYYYKIGATQPIGVASAASSTALRVERLHPVKMRTQPTVTNNLSQIRNYNTGSTSLSLNTTYQNASWGCVLVLADTGLTAEEAYMIDSQGASGALEFDAEL